MDYGTVVLGNLFYGILRIFSAGKPEGFDRGEFINLCTLSLKDICDTSVLEGVLKDNRDEGNEFYIRLIEKSYDYGLSEEENFKPDFKNPLYSIFSFVDIGRQSDHPMYHYVPGQYTTKNAYPTKDEGVYEKEFISSINGLYREVINILNSGDITLDKILNQLNLVLLKYAWCIPAFSNKSSRDVSLYDYLKVTTAISGCLYYYHEGKEKKVGDLEKDGENKFRVLVGDVSGIQNYIFSGTHSSGIAKRLRAKSFVLGMISDMVSFRIVKEFNLSNCNIIISSGGKFYILLPNTEDTVARVDAMQRSIDEYLLKEYQGQIALNLSSIEMTGADFKDFGKVLSRLGRNLSTKKNTPFKYVLAEGDLWQEDKFLFDFKDSHGLGICRGCGIEFAVKVIDEVPYGEKCLQDIKVGSILPKVKALEITEGEGEVNFWNNTGLNIHSSVPLGSKNQVLMINSNELYKNLSAVPKYMANYVPLKDGSTLTFAEMAENSIGAKVLGYFKADVDNLGNIFAFGLKGEKNRDSITRTTALSRMLDLFFTRIINEIIKEKFNNCYMVFSGGDDIFIIGPWNEIIDFSICLHREFEKYTGYNKNITLSAGIALSKPRTSISRVVEEAEELLDKSKEAVNKKTKSNRNQVTLFGRTLSWEDFEEAIKEGKRLADWVDRKLLAKNDLWKLKKYDEMFQDFYINGNVEGLMYNSLLHYEIGRKKKERRDNREIIEWQEGLFNIDSPRLINLGVSVDYAMLYCKEES